MKHPEFNIIGIETRTTNENDQAATDIGALWKNFLEDQVLDKIPNKEDTTIYSVYTDYEKDHTKPYTVVLGCKVAHLDEVPEGMVGRVIPGGTFTQFTAKGNLYEGAVYAEWLKIWKAPLNRKFTADYEVYGPKSHTPESAEVDIFIAVD